MKEEQRKQREERMDPKEKQEFEERTYSTRSTAQCKDYKSNNKQEAKRLAREKRKQIKEEQRKQREEMMDRKEKHRLEERKNKKKQKKERKRKQREEYEQKRKEELEKSKIEQWNRDCLGIGFYENVCHDILNSNNDSNKKNFEFKPEINRQKDALIGTYDVIYYAAIRGGGDETVSLMNRTTKGTLKLSWNNEKAEDADTTKQILHGEVKMDTAHIKDTGISQGHFYFDFTFNQLLDTNCREDPHKDEPIFKEETTDNDFIPFTLNEQYNRTLKHSEDVEDRPIRAKIKIISKRNALGRRGFEFYSHPDDDADERHPNDVLFTSLLEAEEIDKASHDDDQYTKKIWSRNRKKAAKVDDDCLSYKPKPVFFIEEGDIHLEVTWLYHVPVESWRDPAFCNMVILARRRSASLSSSQDLKKKPKPTKKGRNDSKSALHF